MKRLLGISLLVLFLSNTLLKSALIINYLQNVKEITENCCINKNRPELNCHGKCFIDSQLNRIDRHSENDLPARMVLSDFELYMAPAEEHSLLSTHIFRTYTPFTEEDYQFYFTPSVFQPPTA